MLCCLINVSRCLPNSTLTLVCSTSYGRKSCTRGIDYSYHFFSPFFTFNVMILREHFWLRCKLYTFKSCAFTNKIQIRQTLLVDFKRRSEGIVLLHRYWTLISQRRLAVFIVLYTLGLAYGWKVFRHRPKRQRQQLSMTSSVSWIYSTLNATLNARVRCTVYPLRPRVGFVQILMLADAPADSRLTLLFLSLCFSGRRSCNTKSTLWVAIAMNFKWRCYQSKERYQFWWSLISPALLILEMLLILVRWFWDVL